MFEGRYRLVVAAALADEIAFRRLKERSLFQGSLNRRECRVEFRSQTLQNRDYCNRDPSSNQPVFMAVAAVSSRRKLINFSFMVALPNNILLPVI
jgi:hypothetical protein